MWDTAKPYSRFMLHYVGAFNIKSWADAHTNVDRHVQRIHFTLTYMQKFLRIDVTVSLIGANSNMSSAEHDTDTNSVNITAKFDLFNTMHNAIYNKNLSGDEIANVNFLPRHRACRCQSLRPLNRLPNFYYN